MRIRTGFVSNSSSTSFCIYGTFLTTKCDDEYEPILPFSEDDIKTLGLCRYTDYDFDDIVYVYIGRHWCDIEDDETGAAFKQDVKEKITKLLDEAGYMMVPDVTFNTYDVVIEA